MLRLVCVYVCVHRVQTCIVCGAHPRTGTSSVPSEISALPSRMRTHRRFYHPVIPLAWGGGAVFERSHRVPFLCGAAVMQGSKAGVVELCHRRHKVKSPSAPSRDLVHVPFPLYRRKDACPCPPLENNAVVRTRGRT